MFPAAGSLDGVRWTLFAKACRRGVAAWAGDGRLVMVGAVGLADVWREGAVVV